MAEVKVFGVWVSPYSRRVELALKLKGVDYEYIEEDLSNKSPLLLKHNPVHKKVPVLVHNGKPVAESLVILDYIDETWDGPAILPKDPYERAMARFWAKFIDEKCIPAMKKVYSTAGEEREKAMEEAFEFLKFLDNEIKGKKFFGGETIGLVDIAANFIAHWSRIASEVANLNVLTEDKLPNLCRWIDEYTSCRVVKESLPPKDKLAAFLKSRLEAATAPK